MNAGGRYDDIINLEHPTSVKHPRMPLHDRAAQFSPFAALRGHDAAVKETARLTEPEIELGEDMIRQLDERLQILKGSPGAEVTVTYFVPDEKKSGGTYISYTGTVKRIDEYEHALVMTDRTVIPIGRIKEIESM